MSMGCITITKSQGKFIELWDEETGDRIALVSAQKKEQSSQLKITVLADERVRVARKPREEFDEN